MRVPAIAPVADGLPRPKWSVMIPVYNCAHLLRQTLESVLAQAPDASQMQIEVIDDCSTKDDPEQVVNELGCGRVTYYRKPENSGPILTFNTCIERSRGEWVHILHGDDWVLPEFYKQVEQAFVSHAKAALVVTRCLVADEQSQVVDELPMVSELAQVTNDTKALQVLNPLRTPAVVIRRSFYESHGGFMPEFIHTADWEMWVRAIRLGGGVMLNQSLACYREFAANHTALLARTGRNLEDRLLLANYWQESGLPGFDHQKLKTEVAKLALYHARHLQSQSDGENAHRCMKIWDENASLGLRLQEGAKDLARKLLRR